MPSPSPAPDLERGRAAYDRGQWQQAWELLSRAAEGDMLAPAELERLAEAAFLAGHEEDYVHALERAHHAHLDAGDPSAAGRSAVWLGVHLAERGDMARASGWFGRAARVLERVDGECVEAGYLLLPTGLRQLAGGETEAAYRTAGEAAALAERFGDADLLALAVHMQGRARLRAGGVREGLALLDEAMVAVTSDTLSPVVTGLIYCSVISACRDVHALGRAHEWTAALSDWCERQPEMVAYSGECRVYRAELMQLHGEWRAALVEAQRAGERLPETSAAAGLAFYQKGEAHRLLGELEAAESAYRAASRAGREPLPGLALLRLAQGDAGAAAAALRRALGETDAPHRRARLLPALVEALLALDEVDAAREACDELDAIARAHESRSLGALAAYARGATSLEAGDPAGALGPLRQAAGVWRDIDAPYDAARARLLLGRACQALDDHETARLEIDAARSGFERLGAEPDAERARAAARSDGSGPRRAGRGYGLTPREREVLAEVATGKTNRDIAETLYISEKTVARHVSSILSKLGVPSRAAATAFAYEHDLIGRST